MQNPQSTFPIDWIRDQFPSLKNTINNQQIHYLDGPAGTQVPRKVMNAIIDYLTNTNANDGGYFHNSRSTETIVTKVRNKTANFLGAKSPHEISFGANMTSLTFTLSRALARNWQPGDQIILTDLDHDANFSTWQQAANDKGVTIKTWQCDPSTGHLDIDQLTSLINQKTKLIAFTLASNTLGTLINPKPIISLARQYGTLVFADAVHYAPHFPLQVAEWDVDFLACSPYKFYGPHLGILYGKKTLKEQISPYKVSAAADDLPNKWETGTPSFEAICGLGACLDYLYELGSRENQNLSFQEGLKSAMDKTEKYEATLTNKFFEKAETIKGLKIYGPPPGTRKTPTFSFTLKGFHPDFIAEHLAKHGISCWSGHFYAKNLIKAMGLEESGGLVRVGCSQYTSESDLDAFWSALEHIHH